MSLLAYRRIQNRVGGGGGAGKRAKEWLLKEFYPISITMFPKFTRENIIN